MAAVSLPKTCGAILLGGFVASVFSGLITAQVVTYIKRYPSDPLRTKLNVAFTWFLDCTHTVLVWMSSWTYMVEWYGDYDKIDQIPAALAVSVVVTAALTFNVHCFYARRIHKLTHNDWRISYPIVLFSFVRLVMATSSSIKMFRLQTLPTFRDEVGWLITTGLSLSCSADILVVVSLCVTLRNNRSAYTSMDRIINSIMLYTLENHAFTSAIAITVMICWISMTNLIFLGVHFVLSKLYTHSLLATLNSRKLLLEERSRGAISHEHPVAFPGRYQPPQYSSKQKEIGNNSNHRMEITVEQIVEYESVEDVHSHSKSKSKRGSHNININIPLEIEISSVAGHGLGHGMIMGDGDGDSVGTAVAV